MGLFSKIFGKKDIKATGNDTQEANANAEKHPVVLDLNRAKSIMEKMKQQTERDVFYLKLSIEEVKLCDSKLGGIPYLPTAQSAPCDAEGHQLRLLAQICLDELPAGRMGLPKTGLLQFWALDDDLSGMDTKGGHAVIYYEKIDTAVTEYEAVERYDPYVVDDESYFPVQDTFKITFGQGREGMSISDYQFDKAFAEVWNREYPQETIESFAEMNTGEAEDYVYDTANGSGHKIGGYPMFTQYDPRENGPDEQKILLLQIDSFGADGKEIMWGDAGVGNFFIDPEDLKKKDFSNVLYTWDCY